MEYQMKEVVYQEVAFPKIFTYFYSTAKNPLEENYEGVHQGSNKGWIWLWTSKFQSLVYMHDIVEVIFKLYQWKGYGTDAYLHLSRLGDSQEPLP
ncbi:pyruvate dehydrogenase (acetyl-transferring) kinase, mitochondrial-like [Dioscorea cayenensis subsp. rotundata]|uniref:Pyruvate dehydrogenase (Acetyl-transferring) kinase, mitochondrial-like n=1 Tax=Dioscorea cayennensis subsp. rotundata TaxID=55577 RepID=A0AB40BQ26_DIOCR|nr:pyruvate dehydrogenase (acetyl-transferring) kinase, mitochondrial-like [Dioscorea cayenensis subsp. rotundata]